MSVFLPVPYYLGYGSFVIKFEIRNYDASSCVRLSQDSFGYSRSFLVPYKFYDCFFYFCEKCHWNFHKDCIESIDGFE